MRTPIRIAAIAGVLALATLGVGGAHAATGAIYDSIPSPQPSNLPSLGYQATQTAEFGDDIAFAAGTRALQSVNVYMSSWACENWATADALCTTTPGATFTHPITLNFYAVTHDGGGAPVLGAQLATFTQTFTIPYRPSADTTCPNGTGWRNAAGSCFNGFGVVITFALNGFVVPDEIVYGIAYNTNTWGAQPLGVNGPFESLNVGLAPNPGVGTDVNPDLVFWNTQTAGNYADNGAAGVGTFRADTRLGRQRWAGGAVQRRGSRRDDHDHHHDRTGHDDDRRRPGRPDHDLRRSGSPAADHDGEHLQPRPPRDRHVPDGLGAGRAAGPHRWGDGGDGSPPAQGLIATSAVECRRDRP